MLRAHETKDKDQSDEEEEEALDVIQMDIYSEDRQLDNVARTENVIFRRVISIIKA